jgi:hypothetical protein
MITNKLRNGALLMFTRCNKSKMPPFLNSGFSDSCLKFAMNFKFSTYVLGKNIEIS